MKVLQMHYIINIFKMMNTQNCDTYLSPNTSSKHQISSDDSTESDHSGGPPQELKLKSELCKKFVEKGSCPYGNKCKFAHGRHELRQSMGVNLKYKTKQCFTFFNENSCKYGNRCNFVHRDFGQKKRVAGGQGLEMVGEYGDIWMQGMMACGRQSRVVRKV